MVIGKSTFMRSTVLGNHQSVSTLIVEKEDTFQILELLKGIERLSTRPRTLCAHTKTVEKSKKKQKICQIILLFTTKANLLTSVRFVDNFMFPESPWKATKRSMNR